MNLLNIFAAVVAGYFKVGRLIFKTQRCLRLNVVISEMDDDKDNSRQLFPDIPDVSLLI